MNGATRSALLFCKGKQSAMTQTAKWIVLWIIIMGLGLALSGFPNPIKAQNASAIVTYSVPGKLLFHNNQDKIFLTDTITGQTSPIIVADNNGYVSNPIWNATGTSISFEEARVAAVNIFDQTTNLTKNVTTFSGREEVLFVPMAWISEDQYIIYRGFWGSYVDGMVKSNYSIDLFDLSTETMTTITEHSEGELLTNLPLPPTLNSFQFKQLRQVVPNPVDNDWWVIQMDGIVPGEFISNESGTYERPITIAYLWNYQTNAMIGLNELFNDPISSSERITWSPDGRYLELATYNLNDSQNWIVYFDSSKPTPTFEVIDYAQTTEVVYDWLGVGDLFLSLSPADKTPDTILYVSQIINGEWKSREFIRFSDTEFPVVFGMDWHITASPQEQMQISCIFDESLNPQLSIGNEGQVATFDATISHVWAEPDLRSPMINDLQPNASFEIIDGPACRSGYRWWQIELDNNSIGWAIEASKTTYFLQPISGETMTPPITSTEQQTPIPSETPTSTPPATNAPSETPTATATLTLTPVPAAAILFTSERDGNHEIYSMAADGSNVVRLTNNSGIDFYPTWFPDHSKIVFASTRNGNLDVYTMLADGSNVTQLTTSGGDDYGAQVSPDGTQMLFVSSRDGNLEIYRMNVDGTNQVRLTDNTVVESIPSWSPDGSKISFASFRDNNMELYTANPDGSNPTRLTNNSAQEYGPSWSPDGTRLAFVSTRDGNMEIYVMNVDGSNLTRLTTNSASDGFVVVGGTAYYGLAWSPDSSQLVFLSDRDGNVELYKMNADGTNPTRLTDASGVDSFPDW